MNLIYYTMLLPPKGLKYEQINNNNQGTQTEGGRERKKINHPTVPYLRALYSTLKSRCRIPHRRPTSGRKKRECVAYYLEEPEIMYSMAMENSGTCRNSRD